MFIFHEIFHTVSRNFIKWVRVKYGFDRAIESNTYNTHDEILYVECG